MEKDGPGGKCGAKCHNGKSCSNGAGMGTDHAGWGRCKFHFGSTPAVRLNAERARIGWMAKKAAGALQLEVTTTPEDALNAELQRSAQMVGWIEQQLERWPMDDEGNIEIDRIDPETGVPFKVKVPAVTAFAAEPIMLAIREMFMIERKHLAAVAKWAVDSSLIERKLALDEKKVDVMSDFIARVITDLGLDPNDNGVRRIVSTRLRELASA